MQVPLGVIPENETSYEGMICILEELQKYIPSKVIDIQKKIPGSNLTEEKTFITTLVGGDYLSAVRARGAMLRGNSELQEHGLNDFLPVSEDWHAKVCLMEVSREFMSTLPFIYVYNNKTILLHYMEAFILNKLSYGERNTFSA